MSDIQQRLEKIQQEQQSSTYDVTKEKLKEIVSIVKEKRYQDPSSYYQSSVLSKMLPTCYPKSSDNNAFKLDIGAVKMESLHEETLFYIFYSFPGDELQLRAYAALMKRKYVFSKMHKCFLILGTPAFTDNAKRSVVMFDPFTWTKVSIEVLFDDKFVGSLEK